MDEKVSDILRTIASSFAELEEALKAQQRATELEIKGIWDEVSRNRDAIKAAANAMLGALE